jgi:uncharacterized protein
MTEGSTAVMISKDQIAGELAYWVYNPARATTLARRALVASTPEARRIGLLNRTSLPAGEGLLIVPANKIHTVGMKFPIDVAFLDKECRVVQTYSILEEGRFVSGPDWVDSALELPAGTLSRTETRVGDILSFTGVCA